MNQNQFSFGSNVISPKGGIKNNIGKNDQFQNPITNGSQIENKGKYHTFI